MLTTALFVQPWAVVDGEGPAVFVVDAGVEGEPVDGVEGEVPAMDDEDDEDDACGDTMSERDCADSDCDLWAFGGRGAAQPATSSSMTTAVVNRL